MIFGVYSYLVSVFIFAGAAIALELFFGFHLLKKYLRAIVMTVIFYLPFPLTEAVALWWRNWDYNPETTLYTRFLGAEVETYVYALMVAIAVSCAVVAWTFYEDQGKPILLTSLKDVFQGTYAIWHKEKTKISKTHRMNNP